MPGGRVQQNTHLVHVDGFNLHLNHYVIHFVRICDDALVLVQVLSHAQLYIYITCILNNY